MNAQMPQMRQISAELFPDYSEGDSGDLSHLRHLREASSEWPARAAVQRLRAFSSFTAWSAARAVIAM